MAPHWGCKNKANRAAEIFDWIESLDDLSWLPSSIMRVSGSTSECRF
jgi:hypothetical protein